MFKSKLFILLSICILASCGSSEENIEQIEEKGKLSLNLSTSLNFEVSPYNRASSDFFEEVDNFVYIVYNAKTGAYIKDLSCYSKAELPTSTGSIFTDELPTGKYHIVLATGARTPDPRNPDRRTNFSDAYLEYNNGYDVSSKDYLRSDPFFYTVIKDVEIKSETTVKLNAVLKRQTSALVFEMDDLQEVIDNIPNGQELVISIYDVHIIFLMADRISDFTGDKKYQAIRVKKGEKLKDEYHLLPKNTHTVVSFYYSGEHSSLNSITIPQIENNTRITVKGNIMSKGSPNVEISIDKTYDNEIEMEM